MKDGLHKANLSGSIENASVILSFLSWKIEWIVILEPRIVI